MAGRAPSPFYALEFIEQGGELTPLVNIVRARQQQPAGCSSSRGRGQSSDAFRAAEWAVPPAQGLLWQRRCTADHTLPPMPCPHASYPFPQINLDEAMQGKVRGRLEGRCPSLPYKWAA